MVNKSWKSCDECKRQTRNIRIFKGEFLCFPCYQKHIHQIGSGASIFSESLNKQVIINLSLTSLQKKLFDERLKYLFPSKKNKSKYSYWGLNQYVRALILADLEFWEKKNGLS